MDNNLDENIFINVNVLKYYAYIHRLNLMSIARAIGTQRSYVEYVFETGSIEKQKFITLCEYLQCTEDDLLCTTANSVVEVIKNKSDQEINDDTSKKIKIVNKTTIKTDEKIVKLEKQIRDLKMRNEYLEDIIKNIEQIACQIL